MNVINKSLTCYSLSFACACIHVGLLRAITTLPKKHVSSWYECVNVSGHVYGDLWWTDNPTQGIWTDTLPSLPQVFQE